MKITEIQNKKFTHKYINKDFQKIKVKYKLKTVAIRVGVEYKSY